MISSYQIYLCAFFGIFLIFDQCLSNNEFDKQQWRKVFKNNKSEQVIDFTTKSHYKEVPIAMIQLKSGQKPFMGNGSNPYVTILEFCHPGYQEYKYDTTKCVPFCEPDCGPGGICIGPNHCSCVLHHVPNLSNECVTTCPFGCLNGKCHANGVCTCNTGYKLDKSGKFCIPICPNGCPTDRNCTAPGICECKYGYELSHGYCQPICNEDCVNGVCTAPNYCTCQNGFIVKDGICQAECEQNCDHGKCISRNVCVCNEGYIFDPNSNHCIPNCNACYGGACVAPNECKCHEDYIYVNGICQPICIGCTNGECIAPGECVCNVNYHKNRSGKCVYRH